MVLTALRMVMAPEKLAEAVGILVRTAERTRVETGCDRCHVYQDTREPHVILLEEAWRSDEELDHHLRSDGFHDVLVVMEMAVEPPEIQFSAVARVDGMERAEAARTPLAPFCERVAWLQGSARAGDYAKAAEEKRDARRNPNENKI